MTTGFSMFGILLLAGLVVGVLAVVLGVIVLGGGKKQ